MPWTATKAMSEAAMLASSSVSLMRDVWEGPLGAVRPDDLPSWLTEDACTTATGSWLLSEAARASTATAAHALLVSVWGFEQEQHCQAECLGTDMRSWHMIGAGREVPYHRHQGSFACQR